MTERVVVLAGGTGSAKLLGGLASLPVDLTVVGNVGDNYWTYGVLVCPDLDVTCYTLAGVADRKQGWGIAGDTFGVMGAVAAAGHETWFRLGDRDLANCVARTGLLKSGATLTEATAAVARGLGVSQRVLPATDDPLETRVRTPSGDLHLQEFWVREKGRPAVEKVWYRGAARARVSKEAERAIARADKVVVCPANPVSSVGPLLAVKGVRQALGGAKRVVALSPMEGRSPFSGPARKMMAANGIEPSSLGVAERYAGFLDAMIISEKDADQARGIEKMGIRCEAADTRIRGPRDSARLAEELIAL